MKIDDTFPRNYTELTVEQKVNRFTIVHNPEIELCFSTIPICTHIFNNHIHQLYQLDKRKRIERVFDKQLDDLLKRVTPFMEVQEPYRFDCEHRQVFHEAFKEAVQPYFQGHDEYDFWKKRLPYPYYKVDGDGKVVSQKVWAELINDFIYALSKRLNEPRFRQKLAERQRKAEHQYERAKRLVDALRAKYSKLLILRVDLCWKNQNLDELNLKKLKSTLSDFLKRFHHDPALPNIVGYIWKLEFGQQKGYHYHCMFFLNGNKYQNDAYYAEQIGSYWCKYTNGQGIYHNCNRNKVDYRHLAIGMARHDDQVMFDNLDKVLVYICKQDQFIIDKHLSGIRVLRTFQTSAIPKTDPQKPLGRPRNHSCPEIETTEHTELTTTS
ncbi:YagK/YfjJ domain-containing protein [Acinetobacter venetianus]|uniref:YagK/YfjJ C-terminal domain-containing protein n=1 Tax=Acinetobacter venetianus TaxID=52133 RepID=A0A150HSL6_9GAMM|nr:inovirus-type Gp2 protein [Acinetobacter venetianus]KXZ69762.1 hypothetical protein AVENLUH13518_02312 [Acinetobacter venetianus]